MEYSISGNAGETLFEAMQRAGIPVESPCGGNGICGKCLVETASDALDIKFAQINAADADTNPGAGDRAELETGQLTFHTALACGTKFWKNGQALIKVEERTIQAVNDSILPLPDGESAFAEKDIEFSKPTLGNTESEMDRIENAIGLHFSAPLQTARCLGSILDADNRSVSAVLQYGATDSCHASVEKERPVALLAAAVDIGTTTVAIRLLDARSDKILGTMAEANTQRWAGADVISRISAAENPQFFARLRDGIRGQIGRMLLELAEMAAKKTEDIRRLVIAGNPTMLHLLAGVNPAGIARAPFVPVFNASFDMPIPEDISEWPFNRNCQIIFIPGISAYVGADIVAGAMACGLHKEKQGSSLFLDLGTNGEMMLFSGGRSWCCSAAAGPAFEGAAIEFGCPSVPDAIDHVAIRQGRISISVLGGGRPIGICGSGILDAVACMLQAGVIDETGRICPSCESLRPEYFIIHRGKPAILLDRTTGISITQDDIRQVQLAKAAVAAGIEILMSESGLHPPEIQKVYLAGGFGSRLDPASAIAIGLLPKAFSGNIQSVGNSSLAGAGIVALRRGTLDVCSELARHCINIELSGRADFIAHFSEAMLFPETTSGL
ncbi:MAG: ASKHA domain-containing protein [Spirochaetaceae bacterium]|nr:ASKHA domain-containing protein [Spirochaetaceae bacterium]